VEPTPMTLQRACRLPLRPVEVAAARYRFRRALVLARGCCAARIASIS
jgi:hypothetical protein